MRFDETPDDRKAQPASSRGALSCGVCAIEAVEDPLSLRRSERASFGARELGRVVAILALVRTELQHMALELAVLLDGFSQADRFHHH